MEPATTPMTERLQIPGEPSCWYNGWLRILLISTSGFTAVRWIVANFDNEWEMTSADIDAAIAGLRRECVA